MLHDLLIAALLALADSRTPPGPHGRLHGSGAGPAHAHAARYATVLESVNESALQSTALRLCVLPGCTSSPAAELPLPITQHAIHCATRIRAHQCVRPPERAAFGSAAEGSTVGPTPFRSPSFEDRAGAQSNASTLSARFASQGALFAAHLNEALSHSAGASPLLLLLLGCAVLSLVVPVAANML